MRRLHLPALPRRGAILLALMAAMLATRAGHFLALPDASWAVFLLGGLYLRRPGAFALLAIEAVVLDGLATRWLGVSAYCLTVAYAFVPASYACLWLAGARAARARLPAAATCMLMGLGACYLLSNGSFYWLGGRVAEPSLAGWGRNLLDWYWPFLRTTAAYTAAGALPVLLRHRLRPAVAQG